MPLYRHSTLPELQEFVTLFRPKLVVPNTLDPRLKNLDWACLDRMFAPCLHSSSQYITLNDSDLRLKLGIGLSECTWADRLQDVDVSLENLTGNGSSEAAQRWADHGKLVKKVSILREYLGEDSNNLLDELWGIQKSKVKGFEGRLLDYSHIPMFDKRKGKGVAKFIVGASESDEETDCDGEEEHGRTAHRLFANSDYKENIWWASSDASQEEEYAGAALPVDTAPLKDRATLRRDGSWRVNRMTPESSPVHQRVQRVAKLLDMAPTPSGSKPVSSAQSIKSELHSPETPVKPKDLLQGQSIASPICISSSPSSVPPPQYITPVDVGVSLANRTLNPSFALSSPVPLQREKQAAELYIPSTKKRSRLDNDDASPSSSKRPCQRPTSPVPRAEDTTNTLFRLTDTPHPYITFPYVPTLHEMNRLKRMETADQLAKRFPERIAPSYISKCDSLRAYYMRKERDMIADAAVLRTTTNVVHGGPATGSNRPLAHSKTILSFETVNEDDQELDWNRSRMLAHAVRQDVKHGRKVSLPALKCLQSSRSPH